MYIYLVKDPKQKDVTIIAIKRNYINSLFVVAVINLLKSEKGERTLFL